MKNIMLLQKWRDILDGVADDMKGQGTHIFSIGVRLCADDLDRRINEIIGQGVIVAE